MLNIGCPLNGFVVAICDKRRSNVKAMSKTSVLVALGRTSIQYWPNVEWSLLYNVDATLVYW